jgi:hypothetical protein
MSAAATRALDRQRAAAHARRPLEPAEVAWLAVLPCAAIVVLAIVLLGPPLGHAFFEPGSDRFWPEAVVAPEPTEHARFVLALLAAPFAALVVVAGRRRPPVVHATVARVGVAVAQVCTVGFLVLGLLAERNIVFHANNQPQTPLPLFSMSALVVAGMTAVLLAGVLSWPRAVEQMRSLVRETRRRRVACVALATTLIAVWVFSAFNTERTIREAAGYNLVPWDMSEAFAVLDGRTPLVDFHSQYAQLLPYVTAAAMRVVGTSAGGWTASMVVLDGLALLAVYAVFRRVVASSTLGLALFVPFLAGSLSNGGSTIAPLKIFSVWPMRYSGAYLLAWLTARHLDRVAPRRRLLLFAAALVAINNLEFGLPAMGGTLAALLWTDPPRSRAAMLRLLRDVVAGTLAAVVLVAMLSLIHGGALPHLGLLLEFPRIYGVGGWVLEPMPSMGFHMVLYATFLAAIVTATVRAARGDDGVVLTGMLAWSGIFGLGAGSYFAGRSDWLNLIALFSTWCFALLLLTVVVVCRLAGRSSRRLALTDFAALLGCGLAACVVVQTPLPWREVSRLHQQTAMVFKQPEAVRLVTHTTRPGEHVAVLMLLGHRVAYDAEVVNVVPYSGNEAMPTEQQMETTLAAMRDAGVSKAYIDRDTTYPGQLTALTAAGFKPAESDAHYLMLRAPRAP